MGEKAILCISDLHITKGTKDISNPSLLDINSVPIDKLITATKEYDIQYLIVLGDITNSGYKQEFLRAEEVIKSLMRELNITDKEKVFLIPGNHDINWNKYQLLINEEPDYISEDDVHTYHDYKLKDFKEFYERFYDGKRIFAPDRAVIGKYKIEEHGMVLLCVNTLWHESYLEKDHFGYVDYETLRDDLDKIKEEIKGYKTIAVFHHMPGLTDENGKQCIENWNQIHDLFKKYNIDIFMGGHAHTTESKGISQEVTNYYLLTGSFSLPNKDLNNSFLILKDGVKDDKQGFHVIFFEKVGDYAHGENWFWQDLTKKPDSVKFLPLRNVKKETGDIQLPFGDNHGRVADSKPQSDYLATAQKIVLDVLKGQNLFQSGHFHWSLDGRSHSYIKTNYYFENYECLEKIKISFINLIKENDIKTDLLIGYAMQGNVLGSALAAAMDLKYTYMPELNKKHPPYEKELPMINECKYITVIIDLVYTQHIAKQIVDRLKERYPSLQVLNVCSIFYADDCKFNVNGYKNVNIKFLYIAKVELNKCPYNKDNGLTVDDCVIFTQKLDTVHELFDKDEVGR